MTGKVAIRGVGLTAFGRHAGSSALKLMAKAASAALADATLERHEIDGLIVGYATTMPHLMLADLFAEHYGLRLKHAHAVQSGGATGGMMLVLARHLVAAGVCRNILVVAGENRLTGQAKTATSRTLAGVGHPELEAVTGASVPAYYALLASRYFHETGCSERDLAGLAVQMRRHASLHPGAHLRDPITVDDVMSSRSIATPLKLLDCCPMSDGAAALVVGAGDSGPVIAGWGEGHTHQHLSAAPEDIAAGAGIASAAAFSTAGMTPADMDYLAVYDSFTVTLALLLEACGFAGAGRAGAMAHEGVFDRSGKLPLNTHGGLLSYGHCGVAGGLALAVEAVLQLRNEAGPRQAGRPRRALLHAEGGVLSAHVSLVLEGRQ